MLQRVFIIGILLMAFSNTNAQRIQSANDFFKGGVSFAEKGYFTEALFSFKKAISINNKLDSAYIELANTYLKINNADSAILVLNKAIFIIPTFTNAYLTLGNIYRDHKPNYPEAIQNYSKAVELDSTNKLTYYSLAWCHNAIKDYVKAIPFALKALAIDIEYRIAYNELGHAYRFSGLFNEAIITFQKLLNIKVVDLPLLYMGLCYAEIKDKEGAVKAYDELLKVNPRMAASLKKKIDGLE